MPSKKSREPRTDTKAQILDAAERHFALYGFSGTSLRGIISEAQVNVAAVAYHFGGKEELYLAVMERFAAPVVEQQLTRLRRVSAQNDFTITSVLRSFYEPPLALIKELAERGESLSLFLGRAQMEPEPVFQLVDRNYAACRDEYISAFRKLIPGLSEADYQWRFEFMLSLIVSFLTRQKSVRQRYGDDGDWNTEEVVSRLISFCRPGLLQLSADRD